MIFSAFNEAETRYNLIDPLLAKAKWNLSDRSQIWFEVAMDSDYVSPRNWFQITSRLLSKCEINTENLIHRLIFEFN